MDETLTTKVCYVCGIELPIWAEPIETTEDDEGLPKELYAHEGCHRQRLEEAADDIFDATREE